MRKTFHYLLLLVPSAIVTYLVWGVLIHWLFSIADKYSGIGVLFFKGFVAIAVGLTLGLYVPITIGIALFALYFSTFK